jgi:diguanylate cyclase (GGDEF)-like protein
MLSFAAIQVLTPLALALLLRHFDRRLGRTYIRSWSRFWGWLVPYSALSWIVFVGMRDVSFTRPDRLLLATAGMITAFLAIGHLVAGSFDLLHRRPLRMEIFRRLRLALVSAGVLAGVGLALAGPEESLVHLVSSLILSSSFALVYAGCAIAFWRMNRSESTSWILLSVTFAASGIAEVGHLLLEPGWLGGGAAPIQPSTTAVVVIAILQGLLGLAMLIRLLDDERVAALSAADQVAHMAYHDGLTGLPNRELFIDRLIMALPQAERHEKHLAVIFLDIDHFKTINDSLGHEVGDALLKATAERIRSVLRAEDTVARIGGDEFVIMLPDLRSPEDTGKIARKLNNVVREPFHALNHELIVTSSIGIAVYPDDGNDARTLLKNADAAMYQAKEQGRDRYRLFSPSLNHRALERLELEMGLRRGLELGEFELHYQPLIDSASNNLVGFEALVRWDHPTMGFLLPDRFIPAAERCGMIVALGQWVLREACRQTAEWNRELADDFFIAVNLSASEVMNEGLVDRMRSVLEEFGVEPRQIEIEITESAAFQDGAATAAILRELRALGFRISIDDFGSGYSSLSYLKTFPVDTLKIDRLFLQDLENGTDSAITASVIAMAHGMNLTVVAEGVENPGQLAVLKNQSCDRFQGFLFSKALPASEMAEFIRKRGAGGGS